MMRGYCRTNAGVWRNVPTPASPAPVVLMKTTAVTSWVVIGANYKYAANGNSTEASGIAG